MGLAGSPAQVTLCSCSLRSHINQSGLRSDRRTASTPLAVGVRLSSAGLAWPTEAHANGASPAPASACTQASSARSSGVEGVSPVVSTSPSQKSTAPVASSGCSKVRGLRKSA